MSTIGKAWLVLTTLLATTILAACNVGPDYSRPPLDVPTGYKSPATQPGETAKLGLDWWRMFGDEKLNELEEAALEANQDLKAAMARVDEARAAAKSIKSQFYPSITLNPSVIRSRPSPGRGSAPVVTATNYMIPFDLSYEVDIWGKVRRSYESAKAQFQASVDDAEVIRQTVLADVAVDYFTLRSLDRQGQIIHENVKDYRLQVDDIKTLRKVELVSDLEVAQTVALLESTRTAETEVLRQRADQDHALAILLGRPPADLTVAVNPLDLPPPPVPAGLPADLLRRRPDVAEAEQNLAAACAQIGVATAAFFPNVTLTGSAGFQSLAIQDLVDWQHRIWSFGPNMSMPIYEGGLLEAGLAQAKGRFDELAAIYRTTLLGAFRDVDDALNDIRRQAEEDESQGKAVAASRDYLRNAEIQYKVGSANHLVVIDADRSKLVNELTAAQIRNNRLVATVLLIKAVGGGWDAQAATTQPD